MNITVKGRPKGVEHTAPKYQFFALDGTEINLIARNTVHPLVAHAHECAVHDGHHDGEELKLPILIVISIPIIMIVEQSHAQVLSEISVHPY